MSERDPSQNPHALEGAVRDWLEACALDLNDPDLRGTPRRVSTLWREQVLDGYAMEPKKILGDPVLGEGKTEMVVVRDIPCHGMCPHHLMPWTGKATVAYLPDDALVGFGRLADLVRCYTHRLTLQERACNDVADALVNILGARGSACTLSAYHTCLSVPDDKHSTRVYTVSYRGELKERPDLRAQLKAD